LEEEKEISIRTEAVNEILSAPPKWIIRWGISIVFLLIIIFLVLASLIRYPDTLTGNATLTSQNPIITLISKTGGKIVQLPIKNGQLIKKNQVLCVFENSANYTDVLLVDSLCNIASNQIITNDTNSYSEQLINNINIGEVTPAYLQFVKSVKDFNLFIETNLQDKEISILNRDLVEHKNLLVKYQEQINISAQEFKLFEKDFLRDEVLYSNKVISAKEFEDKKKLYFTAQKNFENQKIALSNTRININNIEKTILELQIQQYEQKNKLKQELKQSIQSLQTALTEWKQKYLIIAPIEGKVSYINYWNVNQTLKLGDEMFTLIPELKEKIIARIVLPANNSGKVKKGQSVNIKLVDYPFNEHGMLNGIVENISLVPQKGNYNIEVSLTKGMVTSYNKTIAYKPEMQAQADIITDNKTVLARIFIQFKELINK
jgi:multidrug resistance efflux pump